MKKIAVALLFLYIVLVAFASRAESISISGILANTGGNPVAINVTDGDTIDVTVYSDTIGFYNIVVNTNYPDGSLYLSFHDCNAALHDTMINFYPGLPPVTYNADYCPSVGTDSCYAHYNITYDQPNNTFNLEIDSVTQQNAVTYLWTFGDGYSSELQFPTHEYTTNGLYEVCVNISEPDSGVCQYCHTLGIDSAGSAVLRTDADGFTVNVVPFGSLSTNALIDVSPIEVYPNPTDGLVTLRFASKNATQYDVSVSNTSGKEVMKQRVQVRTGNNEVPLSLENLSQGIYVVALSSTDKEVTSRVVIKK